MEVGAEFEVTAVDGEGEPLAGVEIRWSRSPIPESVEPGVEVLGVTDETGTVRGTAPPEVGTYRLEAEIAGVRCLTPLHVLPERSPWPQAVIGAIVALFVLRRLFGPRA